MALNLVSNYAAQVAHRNLTATDAAASSSLAKLSSGTRVVSAKDDAASLAIGSRISSEVASLKQASVNAGQASSMLQIADGAMSKVSDIMTRMKTLAVQASSDQVSATERGMLDTEYQALLLEIDRIAQDTEFNGNSLVFGSSTTNTLLNSTVDDNLIGAGDGFQSFKFGDSVGDATFKVEFTAGGATTQGQLTLTNLVTGASESVAVGTTAAADAIAVNDTQTVNFKQLDAVVTLNSSFDKGADIGGNGGTYVQNGATGIIEGSSIQITGASGDSELANLDTITLAMNGVDLATGTLQIVGTDGTYETAGGAFDGTIGTHNLTLTNAATSGTINVSFVVTTAFVDADMALASMEVSELGQTVFGEAQTSNTTDFTFKLGSGTTAVDSVTFSINSITTAALGIDGGDITTLANANTAIDDIAAAIDTLNTSRANVGASQNRLEFASANLASSIENQEAARSSLLDLDVAAEMTNFTSKQILMQAGVSMLAQANQMPQNLMRLFG